MNKINISPRNQILIIHIALILVTFAVFWQVNQFDFINLDDNVYVTENSHVQSEFTLDALRWALTTTDLGYWQPLTWLSLMLNYQLFGLKAGGYHITNLILHILNTLLLFWLFKRMTGAVWRSAFVAAFFALHPFHVESVAWIAKRKDLLSAFFWMLSLCLYVYYTEKPIMKRYLLVLLSFVLALMSKPIVITLPLILILLDYWPLHRFTSRKNNLFLWQLKEKLPFFILSAALSIITFIVHDKDKPYAENFPLGSRIANAAVSFINYLEKTIWPNNLAVYDPYPDQFIFWQVAGAALLIIFITFVVIALVKKSPFLFAGWSWYAITILPVLGIIQVNQQARSDHYTYVPLIGISIIFTWGIPALFKSESSRKKILFPAGIVILITLTVLNWMQCGYWRDSITLFTHAIRVTRDNYVAYNIRGFSYGEQGCYQLAMKDFNTSLSLKNDYPRTYNTRGTLYGKTGQHKLALEDFNKAINLRHDYALAYINRGLAYANLGLNDLAIKDFSTSIRFKDDYDKAYNHRAIVYLNQGNIDYGCLDARTACELDDCRIWKEAVDKGLCR